MLSIGLTGGIGSGKSTVAQIFKVLGVPVYNADEAAKKLMNENEELKQKLMNEFGKETYLNGILNRNYLSKIVFNDSYELDKLNAIVHPVVIEDTAQWTMQQKAAYIVKEAALMFEAGTTQNLNYVIGVFAPKSLRILRTMKREGITKEQIEARMNHQIDESIKMKLCDFVINNDEAHLLIPQVFKLHEYFISKNIS